jgi:hypothetical protein
MARKHVQKASDLFNQSTPAFGRKVSFDEAYPEIEDVVVEVKENGYGSYGASRTYAKAYFPGEFIDCSNPSCYGGGFSIGQIIYEMKRNRQTEYATSKICKGCEGSPKGRRRYRSCINVFEIKVTVKYREDQTKLSGQ